MIESNQMFYSGICRPSCQPSQKNLLYFIHSRYVYYAFTKYQALYLETVSLPSIDYAIFTYMLPFQIRTSCEYLDVFLTVLKFSKLLVHLVPSERSTQKLQISRACPGCHVHMRKESGLRRHKDTKIISLIKKGRPAETLKNISVCCLIDSYAI